MINSLARWRGAAFAGFFEDREYFRRLLTFGLPIAAQSFVTSLLGMVGSVMVGQLGDVSIAAVALANQVFFLLQLALFGVTSGSAIFTAQFWGRRDVPNIRRVLGFCLLLGMIPGLVFFLLSQFAPELVLGIYSKDLRVVSLGSDYLRIFGWSFVLIVFSFSYTAVLRSTGYVNAPLIVSTSALGLNVLLSYLLIFGKLGLPALGVLGVAVAGLIARGVECAAMMSLTYWLKLPAAIRLNDLARLDRPFAIRMLKSVIPVMLNEILWSLGITAYSVVYARISTEAIAAMNIATTIDQLAFVGFAGISHAAAIMIGHLIGAGDEERAHQYALRSITLAILLGFVIGGLIFLLSPWVLSLYQVSAIVLDHARKVLTIISLLAWLRACNMVMFVGVLRSGGDTTVAFVLDAIIIWVLGVPLAAYGAFVLGLPVYWVYLLAMSEEFTKWVFAMLRIFSRKWIHNLAQPAEEQSSL